MSALPSALSNHLTFSIAQNLLQKRTSTPKQATPTLFTEKISHRELLHKASFCTEKLGHTEAFAQSWGNFSSQRSYDTQQAFTQRIFYTQKLLHRIGEIFLHSEAMTHSKLSHRESFTRRIFCTQQTFIHSKLLHTTQRILLHTQPFFTHSKLAHPANLHTQQAFTQKSSCTQKLLQIANFYTQQTFTHSKLSQKESFTHRTFHTQQTFTHSKLAHTASFYKEKLLHTEAFTQRSHNTEKHVHRGAFTHRSLRSFYTHHQSFARRIFCTQQTFLHHTKNLLHTHTHNLFLHIANLHTQQTCTHTASFYTESFWTQKLLHRGAVSQRSNIKQLLHGRFYTQQAFKLRKSADKSLSQPWCSHTNTIYDVQLREAKAFTHAVAAPTNLDAAITLAICTDWVAKHKRTTCNGVRNCSAKTGSRRQSNKKTILKHFSKGNVKGKSPAPKLRTSCHKSLSQPWCSHSNTIYDVQLQETIVLRTQPRRQATLTQPLH